MEIIKKLYLSIIVLFNFILLSTLASATIYDEVNNVSLFYNLDDSWVSGTSIIDYTGHGYNGLVDTSTSNSGYFNQGRNSTWHTNNLTSVNLLSNSSGFTISGWLRQNNTQIIYIFLDDYTTLTGFRLLTNGVSITHQSGGVSNSVALNLSNSSYQHMILTYNASNQTWIFYQNGTRKTNFKQYFNQSNLNLTFGADSPTNFTADEFGIWNFTMSDNAAILLFNASNSSLRPGGIGNIHILFPVDGTSFISLVNRTLDLNYSYINYTTVYNCSYSLNGNANVSLTGCLNSTIQPILGQNTITLYLNDSGNLTQSFNRFNFFINVIDNCTNLTTPFTSFYIKDEQNQTLLNNTYVEASFLIYSLSNPGYVINATLSSYSNPANYCSNLSQANYTDLYMNGTIRYNANNYVTRYHYIIERNVSIFTNDTYYDLINSESTSYLTTYQDIYYAYQSGALIDLQRQYLSEYGIYKSVENSMTDSNGQAILHLESEDVNYILKVYIGNVLQYTTDALRVSCQSTPCIIQIRAKETSNVNNTEYEHLAYSATNQKNFASTNNIFFNWSTLDNTNTNITMVVTKTQYNITTQLCNSSVYSSSGIMNCSVGLVYLNSSYTSTVYQNGVIYGIASYSGRGNAQDMFGNDALIYAGLGTLSLVLMVIVSPIISILAAVFGMFMMVMMNLVNGGTLLGIGSAFIWLICAGAIVIWKLSNRRVT